MNCHPCEQQHITPCLPNPCDTEEEIFPSDPCHIKASCVIYEGLDTPCLGFNFGDNYEELIALLNEWKCGYNDLLTNFCQKVSECLPDEEILNANNGLNMYNPSTVRLGGDLITDTTINLKGKNLFITQPDVTDTGLIQYHLTGYQSGTGQTEYWGIKEGLGNTDILTTVKTLATLYTIISSTNAEQNRAYPTYTTGYLARSLQRASGKQSNEEHTIGVFVPTADDANQSYPKENYEKSSYIQFKEGVCKVYSHYNIFENTWYDGSGTNISELMGRNWFKGNVGVGDEPDNPNTFTNNEPTAGNTKFKVVKGTDFTSCPSNVSSNSILLLTPTFIGENGTVNGNPANTNSGTSLYAGGWDTFAWYLNGLTNGTTARISTSGIYTATGSNFSFSTINNVYGVGGSLVAPMGNMSCSATYPYFSDVYNANGVKTNNAGNIDRIIGYRATAPIGYCAGEYSGQIGEVVGVQIDDQQANKGTGGVGSCNVDIVGDTYAIKQLGINDINKFNGTFELSSISGIATLVNGVVVVANTLVNANSKLILTHGDINSSTALGVLTYTTNPGVGFTITSRQASSPSSTQTGDLSDISYLILN